MAVTVGGARRPQDVSGAQEASGSLRRHQETPGSPRTHQDQEAPGDSRMFRKLQGCSRRPHDVPECFRKPERAKSVIGVAKMDPREPNL